MLQLDYVISAAAVLLPFIGWISGHERLVPHSLGETPEYSRRRDSTQTINGAAAADHCDPIGRAVFRNGCTVHIEKL